MSCFMWYYNIVKERKKAPKIHAKSGLRFVGFAFACISLKITRAQMEKQTNGGAPWQEKETPPAIKQKVSG